MEHTRETFGPVELLNDLDDGLCEGLLASVLRILCQRAQPASADSVVDQASAQLGAGPAKQLTAALCAVFLEAAKADATAETLTGILEEYGVLAPKINQVLGLFEQGRDQLRWTLRRTGIAKTTVVGCDWRLDYHVRSSATGMERAPVYFVALKTKKSNGELEDIKFTCSLEQMQDLLSVVRDATKQIERVMASDQGAASA